MPNRILRDGILTSRAVASMSESGEAFFRALMSVVDDFGRIEYDPDLLRMRCFPLRLNTWTVERLTAACHETVNCQTHDGHLVVMYEVSGRKYLQINNFGQRLRIMKSKCPSPDGQTTVTCPLEAEAEAEAESEARIRIGGGGGTRAAAAAAATEPEPQNKPTPEAEVVPIDDLVHATASELHQLHAAAGLTPGPLGYTETALVQALAGAVSPERVAAAIIAAHPSFVPVWQERERSKRGSAPRPAWWIRDGEYLHPPRATAAPPPRRESLAERTLREMGIQQ